MATFALRNPTPQPASHFKGNVINDLMGCFEFFTSLHAVAL